ncbi:hypothetical protein [Actinokineospora sp. UTMC 2448]|uniref:hypothetical protein n=1 Tax=Actinokineospora sp. UTMC 2448 TaxID=2268449 RepID=UPI002164DC3B|nr:hypothetical protein [Actinokineospora sp. UTMC 2448]UVS78467.1 hypothetical protein Actkin_02200 [Actinokineospora sp. UTMC 2448]
MRRFTTGLAGLALIGGAVMASAVPASAVEGEFVYGSITGQPQVLEDPDGCVNVQGRYYADNQTDEQASLYRGPNCTGEPIRILFPSDQTGVRSFESVKFGQLVG